MSPTHDDWFRTFLTHLVGHATVPALQTLAAVNLFENPQGDLVWWNPLACSEPAPGSKNLRPDWKGPGCAQIYPSVAVSMATCVKFFGQPHWADVRKHLRDDLTRATMLDAFTRAYTWVDWAKQTPTFRAIAVSTPRLDARRSHPLRGPS